MQEIWDKEIISHKFRIKTLNKKMYVEILMATINGRLTLLEFLKYVFKLLYIVIGQ